MKILPFYGGFTDQTPELKEEMQGVFSWFVSVSGKSRKEVFSMNGSKNYYFVPFLARRKSLLFYL